MDKHEFTILTYNMAKAKSVLRRRYILHEIRENIRSCNADYVFLQEISGVHPEKSNDKTNKSPIEILAGELYPFHYYGKNAVYKKGHHGNALLSRYEIKSVENIDISSSPFAKRGLLHCRLDIPMIEKDLHLLCVHLDLLAVDRKKQFKLVAERINQELKAKDLAILAGDFNDRKGEWGKLLKSEFGFEEVARHPSESMKTFPSFFPMMQLDRVFYRGLHLQSCKVLTGHPWNQMSDHLPIEASFRGARSLLQRCQVLNVDTGQHF